MSDPLRKLLRSDGHDAGCDAGVEILDQLVEIELAGDDPAEEFPETAAHLRSCEGCRMDYEGVLEAARRFGDAAPSD
jgi:hypothetical protein